MISMFLDGSSARSWLHSAVYPIARDVGIRPSSLVGELMLGEIAIGSKLGCGGSAFGNLVTKPCGSAAAANVLQTISWSCVMKRRRGIGPTVILTAGCDAGPEFPRANLAVETRTYSRPRYTAGRFPNIQHRIRRSCRTRVQKRGDRRRLQMVTVPPKTPGESRRRKGGGEGGDGRRDAARRGLVEECRPSREALRSRAGCGMLSPGRNYAMICGNSLASLVRIVTPRSPAAQQPNSAGEMNRQTSRAGRESACSLICATTMAVIAFSKLSATDLAWRSSPFRK